MNERISRFKTIIAKTILVGLTSTIIQPIALAIAIDLLKEEGVL